MSTYVHVRYKDKGRNVEVTARGPGEEHVSHPDKTKAAQSWTVLRAKIDESLGLGDDKAEEVVPESTLTDLDNKAYRTYLVAMGPNQNHTPWRDMDPANRNYWRTKVLDTLLHEERDEVTASRKKAQEQAKVTELAKKLRYARAHASTGRGPATGWDFISHQSRSVWMSVARTALEECK